MKHLKYIKPICMVSLLQICLGFAPTSLAQNMVVALSPYQQNAVANTKLLLKQLTRLETGSKVVLLDGYRLSKLGEFKLPKNQLSPKALLKYNGKTVAALLHFAKQMPKQDQVQLINAVRLPQLLRFIAENYQPSPAKGLSTSVDKFLDVVVLGSPLYSDPNEPAVSMANAYIPSDGHIQASLALTPYGTAGRTNSLKAVRVHIGFDQTTPIINDQHRFFLQRFWTLFIENQGGKLISFISDQATLFERVLNKAEPLPHDFKLEPSSKLEMIRIRQQAPVNPIYQRELSSIPLDARTLKQADAVEIGISWDCATCDLDLYAQALPNAEPIYFGHSETPTGNHWKDFTSSPSLLNGYETISFHVPLDLSQLKLAVNWYEGQAPEGVKGRLRVSVAGFTFEQPFIIQASSGNRAAGVKEALISGRAEQAQTVLFDAVSIATQTH